MPLTSAVEIHRHRTLTFQGSKCGVDVNSVVAGEAPQANSRVDHYLDIDDANKIVPGKVVSRRDHAQSFVDNVRDIRGISKAISGRIAGEPGNAEVSDDRLRAIHGN
jgi:hypothetical protein